MFTIDTFPDKSLFSCIASALELDGATFSNGTFTAENVRSIVADYIIENKGNVYNPRTRKYEGSVSHEKFTKHVRKPRRRTEFISYFMHLQANGIRDGSFIGGDKELDLIVEIFMLNVQIYDSSDALPHVDADTGDLEYSEYVSLKAPESSDRQDVVLFRENVLEYSLLFTRPSPTASPQPPIAHDNSKQLDAPPDMPLSPHNASVTTTTPVVAKKNKVKVVKSSIAKSSKVKAAYRLSFDGFNKCMESFKHIKWNVDVHRKDSPGAGKGIFCLRPIKKSNCVALYPGHLVDDKGAVVVTCPSTRSLFLRLPNVQRRFSRGHGVNVNSVACPHVLIVDGQFECAA
jgi:hypothetical protein